MLEYKIKFYQDSQNGKEPVLEYIEKLDHKNKAKILATIYHNSANSTKI